MGRTRALMAAGMVRQAEARQRKVRKRHTEHEFQKAAAQLLAVSLPGDVFWSAIDHANAQSLLAGAIRVGRGVKAGLPDILVYWQGNLLGIELKAAGGEVSQAQRLVANNMIAAGGRWCVATTLEEVVDAVRLAGIPCRAAISSVPQPLYVDGQWV